MIYLDNAATSYPKPPRVLAAVQEAMTHYGANPGRSGHTMSVETAKKVYRCRELLAELFGAEDPTQVVFTQNCTHSLNLCFKGLLHRGDHVIISDLEHNSVARPIDTLAKRGEITYDVLTIHPDTADTIAELEALLRPNTRLVAMTHCSNVFGIVTPIAEAAACAHAHGALFLVDAAQSAGVLPIHVTDMDLDFLCMPGHKGLYGPSGTGVLITRRGELLDTVFEGGTGSSSLSLEQPDFMPDKLECGTLNTAGILGLAAGVQTILERGCEAIYRREFGLLCSAYEALSDLPHVRLYTPVPVWGKQAPVLAFTVRGQSGEETCARLNEEGFALRGGYHCAPLAHRKMGTLDTGAARMSLGMYNTPQEISRFVRCLRAMGEDAPAGGAEPLPSQK